jgi:hypothetical protein
MLLAKSSAITTASKSLFPDRGQAAYVPGTDRKGGAKARNVLARKHDAKEEEFDIGPLRIYSLRSQNLTAISCLNRDAQDGPSP